MVCLKKMYLRQAVFSMPQEWLSASRLSYRLDYQLLFGIEARAARLGT